MILPEVRGSFGREEAGLLVHMLAARGEDADTWRATLAERGIDPLLDHPAVAESIVDSDGVSRLPLPLVAYVLLRRCLLDAGVDDRLLADYVASLFVRFGTANRPFRIAAHDDREYHYLVDILRDLAECDGRRRFLLRAHLGNLALWWAGLFPDWIDHRVNRKGGPGLDYYEEMGQTGFALAADDPFARRSSLDAMYRSAASQFGPMRRALNGFSDRYLTPEARSPVDRVLRQARDAFESGRPRT